MKVTVEMLIPWGPCPEYTEEKIRELGGDGLTPLEICDLPIPAIDRLWVLLREEIIPAKELHLFACRCADDALSRIDNPDPRSLEAVRVKRLWVEGKATDGELAVAKEAAREAARAAGKAAGKAAREAARAARAARAAARVAKAATWAAWAAARAARAAGEATQAAWEATQAAWEAARAAGEAAEKYLGWVKEILEI